ncbi:hypothetical protein HYU07_01730 [Candidatus Woesearchaeota archaeon]|nr:hypothetical protein [Candidatus Woesearchaeota archaeon]
MLPEISPTKNEVKESVIATVSLLLGLAVGTFTTLDAVKNTRIPNKDKVEEGYVIPSKLEIITEDLDKNGKDEVIMKYDGRSYLLNLDKQGRPKVETYEIGLKMIMPSKDVTLPE